jgi:hypothetical protein
MPASSGDGRRWRPRSPALYRIRYKSDRYHGARLEPERAEEVLRRLGEAGAHRPASSSLRRHLFAAADRIEAAVQCRLGARRFLSLRPLARSPTSMGVRAR